MKKLVIIISISYLSLSFNVIPPAPISRKTLPVAVSLLLKDRSILASPRTEQSAQIFDEIGLSEYGMSQDAFDYAYKGYLLLISKNKISSQYLTICDFSQSSKQKRFYLIDLEKKVLLVNTYVAHGRNSGAEFATRFSNKPRSLQTSLGFYITGSPYYGEHGLSLRIQGVDPGYNDKAYMRNIVVHGADYAEGKWINNTGYLGRSYGCPAVPKKEVETIIPIIKEGTCLFIYHPGRNYLEHSKILND